jgi:hypothetical protein
MMILNFEEFSQCYSTVKKLASVGYTGESRIPGITCAGESGFTSAGYIGKSGFPGAAYSRESSTGVAYKNSLV